MQTSASKRCPKCDVVKPVEDFHRASKNADGRQSWCKACAKNFQAEYQAANRKKARTYNSEYNAANREKIAARKSKYRAANLEKIAAKQAEYRAANRDKERARSARYRAANLEKEAARSARYAAANRDKIREAVRKYRSTPEGRAAVNRKSQKRYARKKTNGIKFTHHQLDDRKRYYGYKCWMCGEPYSCVDHVKPVSKGGADMLCNLRPACLSCNGSKGDKWPYQTRVNAQ